MGEQSGEHMEPTPGGRKRREKPKQVADELRWQIMSGELEEGDSLGNEPELIERFGVSRPSMREALRILEAEGLISIVRGVLGGVVVHQPDQRQTARTAALLLQARNVPLADVYQALTVIEPAAVRIVASARGRKSAAKTLRGVIAEQEEAIEDPEAFAAANARFHGALVAIAGNQTLIIVKGMLHEVVTRSIEAVSRTTDAGEESISTRRRSVRGQQRVVGLIEKGAAEEAEELWRTHMTVVGKVLLGQQAHTVVDLADHF